MSYAQWRPVNVTYDANGGLNAPVDPNNPYLIGATVTVLGDSAMTMPLYVFTHWNTKPDGSGTSYMPRDSFIITEDITLYAQWKEPYYPEPLIQRLITIAPSANGWVACDKLYAKTRDIVTLTIAPASGYVPDLISVHKTDNETIIVPVRGDGDIRTFIMPPYEVTVSAIFIPYMQTGNETTLQVSAWSAYVQTGVLYINGMTAGTNYRIYNLFGALVYHGVAGDNTVKFPLPGRGVYVITDGKAVLKVVN